MPYMTGEQFSLKMQNIMGNYDGRKVMSLLDDGYKGTSPLLLELKKAKDNSKEISAGDISKKFNISTARVAALLKDVEEKEYVVRNKLKNDLRVTIVELTSKGEEEALKIKNRLTDFISKSIKGIDDSMLETFFKVMEMFVSNVKEM